MKITSIGNYTIMQEPNKWEQIYNNKTHRMLQISGNRVWYSDTHLMKTIKKALRIMKWI